MQFTPMAHLSSAQKAPYEQLPVEKFSFDNGYYGEKVFSSNLPKGGMLRTLMGTTSQRMSTSSAMLDVDMIKGVEIKSGPTRYLFGLHADQQLSLGQLVTKSSDDVTAGNIKLQQFFMATMRLAYPVPGKYHLRGMVMMPVSAFQTDAFFKDHVKETLVGLHVFDALTHFEDGVPVYETYELYVDRILVIEQPLGSLFDVAFNPPPGVTVNFDELTSLRNSFMDWGAGTFDLFTIDNMKERVDSMCGSARAGINVLFNYIRADVLEREGLTPTPMALERAIMAGRYKDNRHKKFWGAAAKTGEGYIDLKPYIKQGVDEMWQQAMQLFDSTIGITAESVNNIFITGGPSGWMQPYVLDQFGEHRVFKVMGDPVVDPQLPYKHLMLSEDLHLRNARGGYLYITKKLP